MAIPTVQTTVTVDGLELELFKGEAVYFALPGEGAYIEERHLTPELMAVVQGIERKLGEVKELVIQHKDALRKVYLAHCEELM